MRLFRRNPFPRDLDLEYRQAVAVEHELYKRWIFGDCDRTAYLNARAEVARLYQLKSSCASTR